jgi:putative copper export protein
LSGLQGVLLFAFHWLEYVGLLGGLGSFVVRRLGRLRPRIPWANPPMHLAFGAAFAGGLGVLAVDAWIEGGGVGAWLPARVAAEGIAFVLCVRGTPFVAPFAVLAAVLLPLSGHAAELQPAAGAEFADAIHVLSAAMWAGGIVALAALRPPGGWRTAEARLLLERFGRIALIAFGVTALTGLLRATEHLNGPSDLWTSSYGLALSLKSTGVLVMLAASLAWRRGLPVSRAEAAVAAVVIGATALLATLPLPPPHFFG